MNAFPSEKLNAFLFLNELYFIAKKRSIIFNGNNSPSEKELFISK